MLEKIVSKRLTWILKCAQITEIELTMWHIKVVVMNWLDVARLEAVVVLVSMSSWTDGLIHIMDRSLDEIGGIVMDWLRKDSFMVSVWIDEIVSLVVNWFLQVHLFSMCWIRPVVLLRCDNIDKLDFLNIPHVWVLVSLVIGLWDVVVIRDPMVLRFVLVFYSLCCWVNPQVLIEVMDCWLVVLNVSWNMQIMMLGSQVSVFSFLVAMSSSVSIIILVISMLPLHALVVMELVFK